MLAFPSPGIFRGIILWVPSPFDLDRTPGYFDATISSSMVMPSTFKPAFGDGVPFLLAVSVGSMVVYLTSLGSLFFMCPRRHLPVTMSIYRKVKSVSIGTPHSASGMTAMNTGTSYL